MFPTPPVLYLMLDFDGVLHPADYGPTKDELYNSPPILHESVFCCAPQLSDGVQRIEDELGLTVKIVLTTSWRIAIAEDVLPIKTFKDYLGVPLGDKVIDITPFALMKGRAEEVYRYLKDNDLLDAYWICIDDCSRTLGNMGYFWRRRSDGMSVFDTNVLLTKPERGFSNSDADSLVSMTKRLSGR